MAENEPAKDVDEFLDQFPSPPFDDRLPRPQNADARVRVLGPDGNIYRIPQENVAEALAEGGRVMTPEAMRELRQETFMQHMTFKDEHKRTKKRKRRSIVIGGRR